MVNTYIFEYVMHNTVDIIVGDS